MYLSPIGEIVYEEWKKSFEIRAELFCDNFVIMPNHLHAILRIEKHHLQNNLLENKSQINTTDIYSSIQKYSGIAFRAPKSISSFAGGFKAAATVRINQYRNTPNQPVWQSRFHDHIILDHNQYIKIFNYIENNIANWNDDQFFK